MFNILLFLAILGTFLALLGPISECCPVLPYSNRKRFRPFPAKSNDSNWIRSPRSMFLHFIRFFLSIRGSQKGVKKIFRFLFCFFSCLEWLNSKKKGKTIFSKICARWPTGGDPPVFLGISAKYEFSRKIWFGHFLPLISP